MSFIIHFIGLFILLLVSLAASALAELAAEYFTDNKCIVKIAGIAGWVIPFALISSLR